MPTPRSTCDPMFRGRWFEDGVIIVAVRWYLTYPLSYRHICELLLDRGLLVAPSTLMRWVLRYAPALEKRWRRQAQEVPLGEPLDEFRCSLPGHAASVVFSALPATMTNVISSSTIKGKGRELGRTVFVSNGLGRWNL